MSKWTRGTEAPVRIELDVADLPVDGFHGDWLPA